MTLRDAIRSTATLIAPHIRRTPTLTLDGSDLGITTRRVTVKLELFQRSGSFKVRGAFANLLLRSVPSGGVVAASGGNHGAAVAFAAHTLGIPAKIFVPRISSPAKIERIQRYGADLVVGGERYADALEASRAWAAANDVLSVHAYDQRETILGQGTIAPELTDQASEIDTVLVAVGGGGLLAGIAGWFGRDVRVVGVEPESAPTLARALDAGKPVDVDVGGIAADSLGARRLGDEVFRIAQPVLHRSILVGDDDIRTAQRRLWDVARVVAEPGGATALAALLSSKYEALENEHVAVVVSGGNTTAVDFDR